MVKEIQLTHGKTALVDDEDYDYLSQFHNWRFLPKKRDPSKGYATRKSGNSTVYMHREIMKAPKGIEVDHRDGNALNNQKYNMRFATRQQNSFNLPPQKNTTSRFKGVSWWTRNKKWKASIRVDGQTKHLGTFDLEISAAFSYNIAAKKYHGEFARLNDLSFPW